MSSEDLIKEPAKASLLLLIALNTVIELVLLATDHGIFGETYWRALTYQNGAFWAGLLHNWRPNYALQPWTMFFTYSVLHGGLLHMVGNMLTLWILGRLVLRRVGAGGFWLIYILSVFGGAIMFGLLSSAISPMVGASGALFGLVGALQYWRWKDHSNRGVSTWPVISTIIVLTVLNLLLWFIMDGLLAWETHLGGFIAGWVAAMAINHFAQRSGLRS